MSRVPAGNRSVLFLSENYRDSRERAKSSDAAANEVAAALLPGGLFGLGGRSPGGFLNGSLGGIVRRFGGCRRFGSVGRSRSVCRRRRIAGRDIVELHIRVDLVLVDVGVAELAVIAPELRDRFDIVLDAVLKTCNVNLDLESLRVFTADGFNDVWGHFEAVVDKNRVVFVDLIAEFDHR